MIECGYYGVHIAAALYKAIIKKPPTRGLCIAFILWLIANFVVHFALVPELPDWDVSYALTQAALSCVTTWLEFLHRNEKPEPDQIKLLLKQAKDLKWEKAGEIQADGQGAEWMQRSIRFVRGKEEAVLWYKDATITLIWDWVSREFSDFIEIEEWVKNNPRDSEVDKLNGERLYLRNIDRFITRHGHSFDLLGAMATDADFSKFVDIFQKAGYYSQKRTSSNWGGNSRCFHDLQKRSDGRVPLPYGLRGLFQKQNGADCRPSNAARVTPGRGRSMLTRDARWHRGSEHVPGSQNRPRHRSHARNWQGDREGLS
jgi:hypothetical protein